MEQLLKATTVKVRKMDAAYLNGQMAQFMPASVLIITFMARDFLNGQTVESTKVCLKKIY